MVILLLLSGFFSSAETSLVAVSRIRIRTLAEEGNHRAKLLLSIFAHEDKMLSAILIGNNLVNTWLASTAATLASGFGGAAVSIATFVITFLILVFGEITPKTMATQNAERLALLYAPVITLLMKLLTPVIWFINLFSSLILRLFGISRESAGPSMTESELRTIVDVSHEEGVIQSDEKQLLNNVFDFGDARAKEVMVPRVHVVMAEAGSTYKDLLSLFRQEQFTRIPIYEDSVDNIIGLVNMKDLLLLDDPSQFDLKAMLRKPYFTVENKKVSDLLMEMKNSTVNMAIVLDEYGELSGIITVEDIIEEIVGEVHDEYDAHEAENIRKVGNRTWVVKGYLSLHDINDELGLNLDSEDFDSIGGLMIDAIGRLPKLGDQVTLPDGVTLQVTKTQKNRIEEVRILFPEQETDTEEEAGKKHPAGH
ncbi:HlyC/CorC family transporter [Faecalibaculum rodentium]|uniref:HlyC/CorC family transporter n=1 Tax=Faecalibaculum rodentium TaxID=1702221 RepID=UPI00256FBCBF|nr:hemolysin family protein [Faecalibaculum rodentium]